MFRTGDKVSKAHHKYGLLSQMLRPKQSTDYLDLERNVTTTAAMLLASFLNDYRVIKSKRK